MDKEIWIFIDWNTESYRTFNVKVIIINTWLRLMILQKQCWLLETGNNQRSPMFKCNVLLIYLSTLTSSFVALLSPLFLHCSCHNYSYWERAFSLFWGSNEWCCCSSWKHGLYKSSKSDNVKKQYEYVKGEKDRSRDWALRNSTDQRSTIRDVSCHSACEYNSHTVMPNIDHIINCG